MIDSTVEAAVAVTQITRLLTMKRPKPDRKMLT